MNKKILAVVFLLVATMAFAADKYISGSGNIIIDPGTSGNVQVKKELRTDSIKDLAGTGTPPGVVPIGGMIAVVPALDTANSWQPPATGVCKDGFMRADGATVPNTGACVGSPLVGRILPNMGLTAGSVNRYPRGSAATSWVTGTYTTGGANTQASNVTGTAPAHYHGMGTGADLNITSSGSHNHTIGITGSYQHSGGFGGHDGSDGSTGFSNHTHLSGNFSGRIGLVTGGVDGNTALTLSMTNNQVNNEASYLEVVYVIRVK
jgi:hypothetical protein